MAVKTKDELLNDYRTLVGADLTDEQIAFVENVTDTINDYETKAKGDGVDWKTKYEENDAMWKKKYTDRFFGNDNPETTLEPKPETEPRKMLTYDDLFGMKGDN